MFGTRPVLSRCALLALFWAVPSLASSQTLELGVRNHHLLGGSGGTLVLADGGVEYRTTDRKDARRWRYEDIKQLHVQSPTRITISTYEDQGWTRAWADRAFDFEVVKGTITPDVAAFLLARIPRPVVTAVLPPRSTPAYRVPAKHVAMRTGSHGELLLYKDALVFESPTSGESRYWRFADLASALALDRYRLHVVAYEGGAGHTRAFEFQLKSDMPPGFVDALWTGVNAAASGPKGGQ